MLIGDCSDPFWQTPDHRDSLSFKPHAVYAKQFEGAVGPNKTKDIQIMAWQRIGAVLISVV